MTLYETIFVRRSVRQYDPAPLDSETLNNIQSFLDETKQIDGQKARFKIVSNKEASINHPHAILAYCDESTAAYINVGYVLEKADLYLQSIGLGSLWLGMAKPKDDKQNFCIMLAFGRTSVPIRNSVEEFNRLPLSEVSDSDSVVAKTARLAPSAVNSQPWKLHFEDGSVTIRYSGRGMMKLILKNRLNKIDLGICTRLVVEALKNEGKHIKAIIPKATGKELEIEVKYE